MHRFILLSGLLWGLSLGPALAQETIAAELVPGARLRVEANGRTTIGGIRALSADTLQITLWEQPGSWSLPLASVRRLELSQGRESRWSSAARWGWRSALLFPALLAVTVLPTCGATASEEDECGDVGPFLVQMGVSGGLIGAVYGSFAPREQWIHVPVPVRTVRP